MGSSPPFSFFGPLLDDDQEILKEFRRTKNELSADEIPAAVANVKELCAKLHGRKNESA
jgi:hypothetical protein